MGKLLLIVVLVVSSIFVIIILSMQNKTEDVPELVTSNLVELQAKALSREALVYGMNKISTESITLNPGVNTQTFNNFDIMGGSIDSIQYIPNATTNDIEINSFATYRDNNETYRHKSTVVVKWVPTLAQGAIYSNGDIDVGGSADIFGNLFPNSDPPISFEEFFGMTKAEMNAIADNHFVDPPNNPPGVEDITWITFSNPSGRMKITTASWVGSGILVIIGDAQISGGTFNGIMWITGSLFINGNNGFNGAIYVEGGIETGAEIDDVTVLGNCQITYDLDAIEAAFSGANLVLTYELKILSMFEDN
ncbi:MAG: hypothetical protein K9N07_06720 [Candidatus Cloacimonetes bacterium]|nr:hypothetical protein [Candidatus Cloacimonadota bacterium]